jgi:hypothetical protein
VSSDSGVDVASGKGSLDADVAAVKIQSQVRRKEASKRVEKLKSDRASGRTPNRLTEEAENEALYVFD